jgi:plastocyanin
MVEVLRKAAAPAAWASLALSALLLPDVAAAQDIEVALVIKDHKFAPSEVKVPAGKKVKLVIENQDATPEEFESHVLNREKVIPPKSRGTVFIGPLKPGRYPFVGEFHEDTARGVVIAE